MCKLTIELVPQSTWKQNLRSLVSKSDWDKLRRHCYKEAEYRCEVCGGVGSKHPTECHEIWSFDDEKKIQTLTGLVALCPSCHLVKHIGFAGVSGKREIAFQQLCDVNGWTENEADDYIVECFNIWNTRSQDHWLLDIKWASDKLKEISDE